MTLVVCTQADDVKIKVQVFEENRARSGSGNEKRDGYKGFGREKKYQCRGLERKQYRLSSHPKFFKCIKILGCKTKLKIEILLLDSNNTIAFEWDR